jgi:CspA family cold shock protein
VAGVGYAARKIRIFNGARGFGFITPYDPGPDIFVHASQLNGALVFEGTEVEFDVRQNPRRPGQFQARNVRVIGRGEDYDN